MKNKTKKIILIPLLISLTILFVYLYYFSNRTEKFLMKQGDEIIIKIERYKVQNGKLPNSLSDLDFKETEDVPIFYKKKNESEFFLYFSQGFDDIKTYSSGLKEWIDGYRE